MKTAADFDRMMAQVTAGEPLSAALVDELMGTAEILPLGMLADAVHRRLHGASVTYVRVAPYEMGRADDVPVPPAAGEIRVVGAPASLDAALDVVARARSVAGDRMVSAFSWPDVERWSGEDGGSIARTLTQLRGAGLDGLASIPLDAVADLAGVLGRLMDAGFARLRLTIDRAPAADRLPLIRAAAALQERHACIQAISPLPAVMSPARPTTGYEDVKMVAIARLAAPNVPSVQVDWQRYGPKLAQVALTFGADDLDAVPASDEAPDGRRRAPLEDVRRNVEAAGFSAVERDGRFDVVQP